MTVLETRRRFLGHALASAGAWAAPAVWAQSPSTYPARAVRLVLPFSPGGTTDIMARLLSQRFQEETGQPLVVENKPGAGGMIATELVQRAVPDGYTQLLCSSAQMALNPGLYENIRYDPIKDFTAIAPLGATPNVLLAHPSQPFRSLEALVAAAKARPGEIAFASPGAGSTAHLAAELLQQRAGIKLIHTPYKGAGPAVTDALGGQVPLIFVAIPSIVQHAKAGRLRPLGVSGLKRTPALADVPAIAETIPDFEAVGWYGIVSPAGVAPDVVRTLHATLKRITGDVALRQAWADSGIEMLDGTPQEFSDYMKRELIKWTAVIKASGVRLAQ